LEGARGKVEDVHGQNAVFFGGGEDIYEGFQGIEESVQRVVVGEAFDDDLRKSFVRIIIH
jgi:hypothetical protein